MKTLRYIPIILAILMISACAQTQHHNSTSTGESKIYGTITGGIGHTWTK